MRKLLTLALLAAASLAAETITDTFTSTMDREPNGLHVVVNGDFSYTPPANGIVVGLSDLTAFSMELTSQFAYGWYGVPPSVKTYNVGFGAIQSFSLDPTDDILSLVAVMDPADPDQTTFTMSSNIYNLPVGNAPEIGIYDSAYGPASDPPVGASTPEPLSLVLCGLGLVGFGIIRKCHCVQKSKVR